MAKTFEILNVNNKRAVMLVKFNDGPRNHTTEIPFPPDIKVPDPGDVDLEDWIVSFWPHSQIEVSVVGVHLAGKAGLIKDITVKVPLPADARNRGP